MKMIDKYWDEGGLFLPDWISELLGIIAFIFMLTIVLPILLIFLFILVVHGCVVFTLSDYTKT